MPSIEPQAEAAPLAPRVLTKAQAAAYCSLTESGFEHWVATGKLPGAMKGTRRWDRTAIDLALDRLSGFGGINSALSGPEAALAKFREKANARKAQRR